METMLPRAIHRRLSWVLIPLWLVVATPVSAEVVRLEITSRVPFGDAIGSKIGPYERLRGVVRLPRVAVPVATYTGWNLRNPAIGAETELLSLAGGRIPFPRTLDERERTGDPRQAVTERYTDFEDYRSRYMAAADQLVEDRYLLPEHLPGLEAIATEHRALFDQ